MEIHKQILEKTTKEIIDMNGSRALVIPASIADKMQLKDNTVVNVSLEQGKHGIFIAIWKV